MSWREDSFWVAASEAALAAAEVADLVFVPSEFLDLHDRFVPLEYSWGLDTEVRRLAWCCSKDDAHRLAPWMHAWHGERRHCAWSNEVFVVCGNVRWPRRASSASVGHWQAWREKVAIYRGGRSLREPTFRPAPGAHEGSGPKVLVVGASGMGNVGDDLLASVLAELLRRRAGARVWWSNSDVDPLHLKGFQAVVVGGGGLVYASRDGRNETQNLANYLKFGPMCRMLGLPVAMFGVSDQDHAGGIDRDAATREFARTCLPQFERATTRDTDSSALLQSLGVPDVRTGPDLLFGWTARARRAVRAEMPQPVRMAMAGELMDNVFVARGVRDPESLLAKAVSGHNVDLLLMSDDDVSHAQRLKEQLTRAGAMVAIQDLRGRGFDALAYAFSQYRGLITTRFHGLVVAAMCDVPVLALDSEDGKKARLLRAAGCDTACLLASGRAVAEGIERVARAFEGELTAVDAAQVTALSRSISVHTDAIGAFSAPWSSQTGESTGDEDKAAAARQQVAPLPPRPAAVQRYRSADLVHNPGDDGGSVGLCWAASTRETHGFGNLGDSLSAVMVAALSGRRVHHVGFNRPQTKLVAVGSIAHAIRGGEAVIWGSGVSIRGGILAQSVPQTHYDVRAIRGPISARHLRDFGISVPSIYGDPVWLLPSIVDGQVEKRYELGVIPHIQDIDGFGPDARPPSDSLRYLIDSQEAGSVALINTWHEATWDGLLANLRLILSCKRIVSQSFHGVVIAEAFGIPVLNFRQMPSVRNGPLEVSLEKDCATDPRVWEFFRGGRTKSFQMYAQRRDERTDWEGVVRAIDARWEPFHYDAAALVESFPMPLAYDPLSGRPADTSVLCNLQF
jgi:polysaccharide pyruvyl transferase WcaK-like protein